MRSGLSNRRWAPAAAALVILAACSPTPAAPNGSQATGPVLSPTIAAVETSGLPPDGTTPGAPAAADPGATSPAPVGALPAPLLLLSPQEEINQIWRIEADGVGVRALTDEAAAVRDFDVSPVDGRLVYVSNNDLIVAAADGSGRTLLVDGPEAPPDNDPAAAQFLLGKPRWSPDGTRIAYSLGGVNLVAAGGGAPQLILAGDPTPALAQPDGQDAPPAEAIEIPKAYVYWPEAWSPDGARLLLGYSQYPESGGFALLDSAGGPPLFIQSPEPFACCAPVWAPDGRNIYYASPFFGMYLGGLWRASAADGSVQTLLQGDAQDGTFHMPGFVQATQDGALVFFYAQADAFPEGQMKLTPVKAAVADAMTIAPLRSDAWLVSEALWAPDGSGVVIIDQEVAGPDQPLGELLYLKADNSPAIPLPISGVNLRWGR